MFEEGYKKMYWDFEFKFNLRKPETTRRPYIVLEGGEESMIYVVDMPKRKECSRESSKKVTKVSAINV